nr:MAG TPA: hypothetical protein [Caudoviricetes sp.]
MRIYARTRNAILYYINLINLSDRWRSPNKKYLRNYLTY